MKEQDLIDYQAVHGEYPEWWYEQQDDGLTRVTQACRGLKTHIDRLIAERNEARAMLEPQPCGHPRACISGLPDFPGDDAPVTQYCAWCADVAEKQAWARLWKRAAKYERFIAKAEASGRRSLAHAIKALRERFGVDDA